MSIIILILEMFRIAIVSLMIYGMNELEKEGMLITVNATSSEAVIAAIKKKLAA